VYGAGGANLVIFGSNIVYPLPSIVFLLSRVRYDSRGRSDNGVINKASSSIPSGTSPSIPRSRRRSLIPSAAFE